VTVEAEAQAGGSTTGIDNAGILSEEMRTVVGYARVSTAEQADSGASLEAQREAIEAEVKRRRWELVELYVDTASGRSLNGRPGLKKALTVLDGGGASVLVVAKLDRLSRSLKDFVGLMEQAARKKWALVALDLGVDTTTPSGRLMANMMASVAEWEREIIGLRTKDALAIKRREGKQLGRPRMLSDRVSRSIERMRAQGLSLQAIADRLNARGTPTAHGGAKWHASTVRAVLNRREN
jgi:DNA invertase Pin-like site-specific DNA recombinase